MGNDKFMFIRRHGLSQGLACVVENSLLYPMPINTKLSHILSATVYVNLAVFRTALGFGYFLPVDNYLFFVIDDIKAEYVKDVVGLMSLGTDADINRNLGIPDFHVGSRTIVELSEASDVEVETIVQMLKDKKFAQPEMVHKVESIAMFENHTLVNSISGEEIAQILIYESNKN